MPGEDEARNIAPRRAATAFWAYFGVVTALGLSFLGYLLMQLTGHQFTAMDGAFVVVAVLLVAGELRPLMTANSPDIHGVSVTPAFVFALLIHWGLPVAVLMQSIATMIGEAARQKAPWRTAFNVAQLSLSLGAAAGALAAFGHVPTPHHPMTVNGAVLGPIVLAGCVYFFVNNALVSQAVALRNRTTFGAQFFDSWGYQVGSTGALLGLAPIIVIVMERGPVLVPLLLLPLAAVYATAALSREKERQSLHDSLTGLPNRKLLEQQTGKRIELAEMGGRGVALFLLDLDRFKEINDTLGHQVGDVILRLVSDRLAGSVRPSDVVARLGGDEFAVLVPDVDGPRVALDVAERVRTALAEPFRHDDMSFEIEASIGIAVSPQDGRDFETLLQRADVAMYVAKERNTGVEVYSTEIDRHSTRRLGMLAELRKAFENHELELHYQPKADLRTGDVVGVEALLRWRHPDRGMVAPDVFVPLAEQTGLMRQITQFVVDEALMRVAGWWAAGLRVQVAVNVCARDLYDRNFAGFLRERLEHHGVPPRALMVEVTESVLMADPARAATTLASLAEVGVGVSLDDFGTGYSSLVHLKRLPVSEVKIDRSFVLRMDVNEDDSAIVRSIIDLSNALGLRVVAEGVETREAWDRLAVFGCDAAQGWYLAKPMPAAQLATWLADYAGTHAPKPAMTLPVQGCADAAATRSA